MVSFIIRRIVVSILILIAASFLMYMLVAYSTDPLQDLQGSSSPNKTALIEARIRLLQLDVPPPLRWLLWLGGAAKCAIPFANACDLGYTIQRAPVTEILPMAMASTVQLVTVALLLAIVLGLIVGIVTALRQYSGLDNVVTFASFFLYSLPSFLVAVMLKEFLAIGFNNFLRNPIVPPLIIVIVGLLAGGILQSVIGGPLKRRLVTFGATAIISAGLTLLMSLTNWFYKPGLGPVGVILLSAGIAVGVTAIIAGLRQRRALLTAGIVALVAVIAYFGLQWLLNISSFGTIVILAIATLAIGIIAGAVVGGPDRGQNMRIGAIVAVLTGLVVLIDRFMQSWPDYLYDTGNRPIATVGSSTPGFDGGFWTTSIDSFTHLALPTLSLLLISFASYTRYARSGLLEEMNQDYIRTARAKGLPERVVVVRHAFRNMLIPITTLVAFDVGALLGGAIITERVFAIPGMGALFANGLGRGDVNPVMGYFIVIAIMAISFNFLADLAYSFLDPRVRVR